MRGWLNDVRSYVPPVGIGEKMRGATLATVLYSKAKGIQPGDTVFAPVRAVPYCSLRFRALVGVSMQSLQGYRKLHHHLEQQRSIFCQYLDSLGSPLISGS